VGPAIQVKHLGYKPHQRHPESKNNKKTGGRFLELRGKTQKSRGGVGFSQGDQRKGGLGTQAKNTHREKGVHRKGRYAMSKTGEKNIDVYHTGEKKPSVKKKISHYWGIFYFAKKRLGGGLGSGGRALV